MSDQSTGRMLLSHNFNLNNNELPALNREEFAQVFIEGLPEQKNIQCSYIQNPHWVVEIKFPLDKFAPQEIGQMCGEILTNKRNNQLGSELTTDTLILGGKKTTPVTSTSPTSLKTGEWGVDVVETAQAEAFLAAINWDTMTADKPSDGIFKIEFIRS
ncbi:MAG: DUF2656 family protein [Cyanobacteria bacterium P01_A01_bin.83]